MKVKTFEDLQVWKDARLLVKSVYELTTLDNFKKDYGFKDQIQRAAVSIMNNISEGFERDNNKEFRNFLNYAKGSAGEVRSMLYVALDLNYITNEDFNENRQKSISLIKQIANFKKYLRSYYLKEKASNVKTLLISIIKI
jgi:four helix bundle protein